MKIREVSSAKFYQPLDRAEGEREKFDRNQWIKKHIDTVANGITDMIKTGYQPYKNPLSGIASMPHNAASKHIYRGVNAFSLRMESLNRGFADMRFVTLNQCNKMGGQVKKGQTGFKILQPRQITRQHLLQGEPSELDTVIIGEDGQRYTEHNYMIFNIKTVFNVEQTTLRLPPAVSVSSCEWETNDFFEKFMQAASIPVREGNSQAFYDPNKDQIIMPHKAMFGSPGLYYGTLLHEFYHATGHVSRENRLYSNDTFGSPEYAREEVRAEIFACLCANAFGLDMPHTSSVTYIDSWLKDRDSKEILRAATEAEDIFRIIVSVAYGQQPDQAWFPDCSEWPEGIPTPLSYEQKWDETIPNDQNSTVYSPTPSITIKSTTSLEEEATLSPSGITCEKLNSLNIPLSPNETATLRLKDWCNQNHFLNSSSFKVVCDPESGHWTIFCPASAHKNDKNFPVAKFEDVSSMIKAFDVLTLTPPTILSKMPEKWSMPPKDALPPFVQIDLSDGTIGGVNGHIIDLTQCPTVYAKTDTSIENFQGKIDNDVIILGNAFKIELKHFTTKLNPTILFHYNADFPPCVMAYAGNFGTAMHFASTQYFKAIHGEDIHFFCNSKTNSQQIPESPILVQKVTGENIGIVMPISIPEGLKFILQHNEYAKIQKELDSIPMRIANNDIIEHQINEYFDDAAAPTP